MFKHAFQGGDLVSVFDSKVNPTKDKKYKALFKNCNSRGVKRVFDKETKGYHNFKN